MRERLSMDSDWLFHLGEPARPKVRTHESVYGYAKAGGAQGPAGWQWNDNDWETVHLPHDWSHRQPFDREQGYPNFGYKPRGTGWYRKKFRLGDGYRNKRLLLELDGIATHATIYVNGSVLERNLSGYTSFMVDITDRALFGDQPNLIAVHVDATEAEGWWYEGAGIYRHVWLTVMEPLHIDYRGIFVRPEKQQEGSWLAHVETTIASEQEHPAAYTLTSRIADADGCTVAEVQTAGVCPPGEQQTLATALELPSVRLWDVDDPYLYTLHSELSLVDGTESRLSDRVETSFGCRTIRVCPDEGFFLNERPLKLKGTCNHQDHAGVGVALPDSLQEYRIRRLKEMGSNAYRCAHHNPTPELLEVCDRLGMLVMDENRRFESSREGLLQLESMVKRDRNHPSVIMYSLFNEEPLQGTPTGRRMMKRMMRTVRRLDPTRPLLGAMHGGVLEDGGTADVMDVTGFNYMHGTYDQFRAKHPRQPVIGSETVSAFSTRSQYEDDPARQMFASYDEACAPWGATAREAWKAVAERDYVMGTFVWTGFDYRGEPTPYEWPSVSTHFGIMDTCGFAKDVYYLYQAFWLDEPVLHLLPHWSWPGREGEPIRIMTHTNCEEAELFVNGRSQGRRRINRYEQTEWLVPYEPGELRLEGYIDGQRVKTAITETVGEAVRLEALPHKPLLLGDGRDAVAIELRAVDHAGRLVPTDNRRLAFTVEGEAHLLGTGNGDPNSHEPDTEPWRSLFHGRCQLIVQSAPSAASGLVTIRAEGEGLEPLALELPVKAMAQLPSVPGLRERYINEWLVTHQAYDERPDPHMQVLASDMNTWEKVDVGHGLLDRLKGLEGFILYRTLIPLAESERTEERSLLFHSIGGGIEIYADGQLLHQEERVWPYLMEVPLGKAAAQAGDALQVTVLIELRPDLYNSGIGGSVVLQQAAAREES